MKLMLTKIFSIAIFLFLFFSAAAQQHFFTDIAENLVKKSDQQRVIIPEKYRTLQLDTSSFLPFLRSLPSEQNIIYNRNSTPVLELPMPNGTMAKFHVWESSIMEAPLAATYPELRTFTGQGIDDPTATIKLDWTEFGFHAMILSSVTGSIFIDPYDVKTVTNYISYNKVDYKKKEGFREVLLDGKTSTLKKSNTVPDNVLTGTCVGTQLRTYRLAVACTHQYADSVTHNLTGIPPPSVAQVLSAVVTTINRVNSVYEKDVAIRLILVANESNILFTTAAGDPFTANNDGVALLGQSQTQIDNRITPSKYDIGHTFSTGGGGVAQPGVVCVNGYKAMGVTGMEKPYGDPYDIDYVAHEIGHEFGASHTYNSQLLYCNGQGSYASNAEPGSGSTIMGYASLDSTNTTPICTRADNLQDHSDPQFHGVSIDQITNYSISGSSCAAIINTGNTPPVVNAGADYTIPKSTFFVLTGSATDVNNDALTYCWEQVDVGGTFGSWNTPSGDAPIFRSFLNSTTGYTRYFPKLSDQINNTTTIGEILPSYARTLHFRLTVRDNRAGGGGVCSDENAITVDENAGPFNVTYPNTSQVWYATDFKTVTWNPAGTEAGLVNCANVTIQLSTDGGNTFPITLVASTPNDGSELIQVPNNITSQARIRVMAVGNVFYDMSNANFSIQTSPSTITYTFTGNGNWNLPANWSNNTVPPATLPAGRNIVINHSVGGNCVLNVTQHISSGARLIVQTGKNLLVPGNLTVQ